jgi:hypothetical protein
MVHYGTKHIARVSLYQGSMMYIYEAAVRFRAMPGIKYELIHMSDGV